MRLEIGDLCLDCSLTPAPLFAIVMAVHNQPYVRVKIAAGVHAGKIWTTSNYHIETLTYEPKKH